MSVSVLQKLQLLLDMNVSICSESFKLQEKKYPNIKNLTLYNLLSKSDIISFHCKPSKDGLPMIKL